MKKSSQYNGGSIANKYFGKYLIDNNFLYVNSLEFENPFHSFKVAINKIRSNRVCVYRVAGPFRNYRGFYGVLLDTSISFFILALADHIVYQSNWSKFSNKKNIFFKLTSFIPSHIVYNGYSLTNSTKVNVNKKKEICFLSWSENKSKGMHDFLIASQVFSDKEYKFTYIGRCPRYIQELFPNVEFTGILTRKGVKQKIRSCYASIFSSRYEACSNALIELAHNTKKVAVLNSSSNPEIVTKNGLYNNVWELIENIRNEKWSKLNYKNIYPWEKTSKILIKKINLIKSSIKQKKISNLMRIIFFVPLAYSLYFFALIYEYARKRI